MLSIVTWTSAVAGSDRCWSVEVNQTWKVGVGYSMLLMLLINASQSTQDRTPCPHLCPPWPSSPSSSPSAVSAGLTCSVGHPSLVKTGSRWPSCWGTCSLHYCKAHYSFMPAQPLHRIGPLIKENLLCKEPLNIALLNSFHARDTVLPRFLVTVPAWAVSKEQLKDVCMGTLMSAHKNFILSYLISPLLAGHPRSHPEGMTPISRQWIKKITVCKFMLGAQKLFKRNWYTMKVTVVAAQPPSIYLGKL